MSGMYDGIVEGGEFYPFACPTCGGPCPRDTDGDGNCGQRYCPVCGPCPDCIESRNPALEWLRLCMTHRYPMNPHEQWQVCEMKLEFNAEGVCEPRWVAIGVAE